MYVAHSHFAKSEEWSRIYYQQIIVFDTPTPCPTVILITKFERY